MHKIVVTILSIAKAKIIMVVNCFLAHLETSQHSLDIKCALFNFLLKGSCSSFNNKLTKQGGNHRIISLGYH